MLTNKLKHYTRAFLGQTTFLLPDKSISCPIFILGCGRSGTTILGTTLSMHSKVAYLNERRDLWFQAYPETDIWTDKAAVRNGKIILTSTDADNIKSKRLRKLFWLETIMPKKPVFIEKLPINNFRLDFINSIFPDARYLHIYRNGLEVAKSIEKIADTGRWFGKTKEKYKWKQLVEIAKKENQTHTLSELCTNNFEKGLLEWRLSTEAVVSFSKNLPPDRFIEVSYDSFITKPLDVIEEIFSFIGIDNETEVISFLNKNISRRSKKIDSRSLLEKEKIIGGDLLVASLNSKIGLTKYYLNNQYQRNCI